MISAQEQALRNLKLNSGATWKTTAKALGITERSLLSYIAEPGTKAIVKCPLMYGKNWKNFLAMRYPVILKICFTHSVKSFL